MQIILIYPFISPSIYYISNVWPITGKKKQWAKYIQFFHYAAFRLVGDAYEKEMTTKGLINYNNIK